MVKRNLIPEKVEERRHFMELDPEIGRNPRALVNIEYLLQIDQLGDYVVRRKGFTGETNETFRYGIGGVVLLQPIDEEAERISQHHQSFYVKVEYFLGKQEGAGVKETGEPVKTFYFEKEDLEELCEANFPKMGMGGKVAIATVDQLPGDTPKEAFIDMFKDALKKNGDFQKYARAHRSFLEVYQGNE